ncbi:sensor histidine kinase [Streptomonospora sediminis]
MSTTRPRHVLAALGSRRFLLTPWPWRSLLHNALTPVAALLFAPPVLLLALPWILLVVWLRTAADPARLPLAAGAVLVVVGAVLLAGAGPLVSLPLAALERARLRLVDARPIASGHRAPDRPGLWAWLRTRYAEPATWREFGYLLLAAVLFAPAALAGALVLATGLLSLTVPYLTGALGETVALGPASVTDPAESWAAAGAGAAIVVAALHLNALIAGAHSALARPMLRADATGELRAELTEVSRSRARLVDAFEAEQRRIERDLHDGAQQQLLALTMELGLARLEVPPDSAAALRVESAHRQAKEVIAELRELIHGIHPQILTDRGLAAALPALADRCTVPVQVRTGPAHRCPAHIEGTAYFVVSEALANVAKHSGAAAAAVSAKCGGGRLVVEVTDDGAGGADPESGTGLTGLADRVAVMDGRMLLSSPIGGPTRLRVELPCQTE